MATWSRERILEFIDLYKENESLWKIRSKDYSNRCVKEKSYQNLIDCVKEFDPEANKDYVVKKINNLRGSFRKELKKVENSKKSGAGLDDVYKPKLWYFDNLLFLREEDVVRTTCSSTIPLEPRTSSQNQMDSVVSISESPVSLPDGTAGDYTDDTPHGSPTGSSTNQSVNPKQDTVHDGFSLDPRPEERPRHGLSNLATRAPKRKSDQDSLLAIARERLLTPREEKKEDAFDYFGKTMAHKLRNLPPEQQMFAEKLCYDLMFEAALGRLSSSTTIFTRPTFQPEIARFDNAESNGGPSSYEAYQTYNYN